MNIETQELQNREQGPSAPKIRRPKMNLFHVSSKEMQKRCKEGVQTLAQLQCSCEIMQSPFSAARAKRPLSNEMLSEALIANNYIAVPKILWDNMVYMQSLDQDYEKLLKTTLESSEWYLGFRQKSTLTPIRDSWLLITPFSEANQLKIVLFSPVTSTLVAQSTGLQLYYPTLFFTFRKAYMPVCYHTHIRTEYFLLCADIFVAPTLDNTNWIQEDWSKPDWYQDAQLPPAEDPEVFSPQFFAQLQDVTKALIANACDWGWEHLEENARVGKQTSVIREDIERDAIEKHLEEIKKMIASQRYEDFLEREHYSTSLSADCADTAEDGVFPSQTDIFETD